MLPEPVPPSGDNWPTATTYGAPISPYATYVPYASTNQVPPPLYDSSKLYAPPPTVKVSRRSQRSRFILASVMLLVLSMGGFLAMKLVHANNHSTSISSGGLGTHPITGTNANCVLPDVDPTAAQNLTKAQLTSGLLNISQKKYEPIDSTTNFNVGQTIYFAFTINSNAVATLSADWCWGNAGDTSHFQLGANHNLGIPGYFRLYNLDALAVGTGVLIVRWNNAVAFASLFVVKK